MWLPYSLNCASRFASAARASAVSDPDDPHALNLAELRHSVEAVNDTWFVSAHLPITWDLRIVGRLGAYTKRLVRTLLRWYINPIVEQQNRFNSAVARATVEMLAYQERMTREWQVLEERVAKLEEACCRRRARNGKRDTRGTANKSLTYHVSRFAHSPCA